MFVAFADAASFGVCRGSVSANDVHAASTTAQVRMHWRRVKPIESLFSEIEIHQCRETKRQIRSGKLSVISFKEIGMLLNRIIIERAHVAEMHVRIDQTRE